MATRIRSRTALYEQDFYAWAREQASLLRAGRYDELDLKHLTEEVEDLGGSLLSLGPLPHSHHHRTPAQTGARAGRRAAGSLARHD
jgi:hypothetical protein